MFNNKSIKVELAFKSVCWPYLGGRCYVCMFLLFFMIPICTFNWPRAIKKWFIVGLIVEKTN